MKQNFLKLLSLSTLFVLTLGFAPIAQAASLTSISDTLSTLMPSVTAAHTIKFTTPTGIATGNTVTLTFPGSSFAMGASLAGVTIADNAGADNAVTTAAYSTNVLTITASASSVVVAGHTATINIPSGQITNPVANTYVVSVGGTFGDSGKFAVVIATNDQVVISTSVDPSITFSVSAATAVIPTLTTGSVGNAAVTFTVTTNSAGGYIVTIKDANAGLLGSGGNTIASSATTLTAGSVEGYGANAQVSSGSPTIAAAYNYGTNQVGALSTTAAQIASGTSTTGAGDTVNVNFKASITGSTKAGTYSDTTTLVATATF